MRVSLELAVIQLQFCIDYLDIMSNQVVSFEDPIHDLIIRVGRETDMMTSDIASEEKYFSERNKKVSQPNGFSAPKLKGRNHSYHN